MSQMTSYPGMDPLSNRRDRRIRELTGDDLTLDGAREETEARRSEFRTADAAVRAIRRQRFQARQQGLPAGEYDIALAEAENARRDAQRGFASAYRISTPNASDMSAGERQQARQRLVDQFPAARAGIIEQASARTDAANAAAAQTQRDIEVARAVRFFTGTRVNARSPEAVEAASDAMSLPGSEYAIGTPAQRAVEDRRVLNAERERNAAMRGEIDARSTPERLELPEDTGPVGFNADQARSIAAGVRDRRDRTARARALAEAQGELALEEARAGTSRARADRMNADADVRSTAASASRANDDAIRAENASQIQLVVPSMVKGLVDLRNANINTAGELRQLRSLQRTWDQVGQLPPEVQRVVAQDIMSALRQQGAIDEGSPFSDNPLVNLLEQALDALGSGRLSSPLEAQAQHGIIADIWRRLESLSLSPPTGPVDETAMRPQR